MFLQKKAGWFVTAASHGFGVDSPLEARVSGGPAAQAPSSGTQAPSLRLSLSLSLSISLSRGSLMLPESPRLSPSHHRDRARDSRNLKPGPGPAAATAAGAAAAGSVTDHYRDDPWKT